MKTDTQLKIATIKVYEGEKITPIMAVNGEGTILAALMDIYADGSCKAIPMAKQCLEANGYTLPGAKWGAKGEILTQND